MRFFNKIFGDANENYLKELKPFVVAINSLESEIEGLSIEALREKTKQLKEKLKKGETLDDILPEAFALVREAGKRTLNQRHFDVQLMGGIALHQGKIAEMKTGEGKTLTATLPLYLNALEEKGVHIVTVNDYLAKRDAVWMGQIYHFLGLTVGCITHDASYIYDFGYNGQKSSRENGISNFQFPISKQIPNNEQDEERDKLGGFKVIESYLKPVSRKEAYAADITYGTNNEFGFDYLRDNMVYPRTITRAGVESVNGQDMSSFDAGVYDEIPVVQREHNFAIVDEVDSILIDEARTPLIISTPDMESSKFYHEFARIIPKLDSKTDYEIDEKLKAVTLTENGINHVEKILNMENIYEERGMKFLHYLEQSLRAEVLFKKDRDYVVKNGEVIIVDEFTGRLMPGRRWSGGLHQAIEAKENVQVQPESLTLASITFQNYFRMYKKLAGMTGTAATSAEEFDKVYKLDVAMIPTNKSMVRKDLPDKVLKTEKGKFEAVVSEIKERHKTGQPILVGTTSIAKNEYLGKLLDREGIPHQILNAKHHEKEGEIIAQAGKFGALTIATNMAGRGVDIILGGNPSNQEEAEKVRESGGLHVIGTERHEARRIDNQLRGRAGRQGDPGSSQFFISLEDDLMRIFGGDRIKNLMEMLKVPEDQPIEAKLISGAIESAQEKIEGMNFDLRKHILEYDDVMNKHREVIYKKRKEFLTIENPVPEPSARYGADWKSKVEGLLKTEEEKKALEEKIKELGENFNSVAKMVALRVLDMLWLEHLENMEHLRDSVRLRAYGQRDPLVEYKSEGHKMFQAMLGQIDAGIAHTILKVSISPENPKSEIRNPKPRVVEQSSLRGRQITNSNAPKIGRNDLCPCGSGKKYKRCHGS